MDTGKVKKRHSISGIFSTFQAIGILALLGFFIANSIFIYYSERKTAVSDKSYQLRIAVSETNSRMANIEDTLLETVTSITQNYNGLWSEENGRKVFDKQELNRLIANKKLFTPSLEYFFALRPGDFTVFQGSEDKTIFDTLAVRDFIESSADSITTSPGSNEWTLLELGSNEYAMICYYYAYTDIYVGVAVDTDILFDEVLSLASLGSGSISVSDSRSGDIVDIVTGSESTFGTIDVENELDGGLRLYASFNIDYLEFMRNNLIIDTVVGSVLCFLIIFFMNHLLKSKVVSPVEALSVAVNDISDPSELRQVPEDAEVLEINNLEIALNTLLRDAVYNRMQLYSSEVQKKEQELIMLRSQLRPHFFLNAITTVNAMTYQNRNEDIRNYIMKLSGFMRYTISALTGLVSLSEETDSVKNYFEMQDIRYPGRVMSFVECSPDVCSVKIPRFLLLTVVENSFKYAMGTDDALQIYIQCTQCDGGILIVIEDNGPGFTDEQIAYYNRPALPPKSDPHIGLTNIKETLALRYGQDGLFKISNALPTGARIEMRIPHTDIDGGDKLEGADS
jgi:cbb3-type cytochrome oxidase subunit 3